MSNWKKYEIIRGTISIRERKYGENLIEIPYDASDEEKTVAANKLADRIVSDHNIVEEVKETEFSVTMEDMKGVMKELDRLTEIYLLQMEGRGMLLDTDER